MKNFSKNGERDYSFKKEERLCSKKQFDKLFLEGNSFLVYPIKVVYNETDFTGTYPVKAAFAVGKKSFKKAVSRNLIKRRMREAYRLNKHVLYSGAGDIKIAVAFIYIGKKIETYKKTEWAVAKSINTLVTKILTGNKKNPEG